MKQEFIDLGLPSGTLWAKHNVKVGNRRHFTHYEIPLLQQVCGVEVPSVDDFKELHDKCTWKWMKIGKIAGYKVTGPNGNSIFLSAAGDCNGASLYGSGSDGYYWSTECLSSSSAYSLYFGSSSKSMNSSSRYCGQSIRAIKHKK